MFCLIAIIVLLVMISNRNAEIRRLRGEPEAETSWGCLWILIVAAAFFIIAIGSSA